MSKRYSKNTGVEDFDAEVYNRSRRSNRHGVARRIASGKRRKQVDDRYNERVGEHHIQRGLIGHHVHQHIRRANNELTSFGRAISNRWNNVEQCAEQDTLFA